MTEAPSDPEQQDGPTKRTLLRSDSTFTEEVREKILDGVRHMQPKAWAARAAGIPWKRWKRWCEYAVANREPYAAFMEEVAMVEAKTMRYFLDKWEHATTAHSAKEIREANAILAMLKLRWPRCFNEKRQPKDQAPQFDINIIVGVVMEALAPVPMEIRRVVAQKLTALTQSVPTRRPIFTEEE